MNPQLQSALSSLGMMASSTIAAYAVTVGIVPADSKANFTNALVTIGGAAVSAGLLWWKSRQHTPSALTAAVNSSAAPGVKVVPEGSLAPAVNLDASGTIVPVKEPAK